MTAMTFVPPAQPTYFAGDRVWVEQGRSSIGLPCRSGTVVEVSSQGLRVQHDDQPPGRWYGWGAREVVPLDGLPVAVQHRSYLYGLWLRYAGHRLSLWWLLFRTRLSRR